MHGGEIIPTSTLWLIPALPLAGFLLAVVFADARRLITIAAPGAVGIAFAVALAAVLTLLRAPAGARLVDDVYPWIVAGPFRALLQTDRSANKARPGGALVFTCNGRGTRLFSAPHHDARAVRQEMGVLPLAGFFAQGELGPVGGQNFIHGFTASVVLFE